MRDERGWISKRERLDLKDRDEREIGSQREKKSDWEKERLGLGLGAQINCLKLFFAGVMGHVIALDSPLAASVICILRYDD